MANLTTELCREETLAKTWFENRGYNVDIVYRDSFGTTFDLSKDSHTTQFVMRSNILDELMAQYLVKVEYRIEDVNTLNRLNDEFKTLLKNENFVKGEIK